MKHGDNAGKSLGLCSKLSTVSLSYESQPVTPSQCSIDDSLFQMLQIKRTLIFDACFQYRPLCSIENQRQTLCIQEPSPNSDIISSSFKMWHRCVLCYDGGDCASPFIPPKDPLGPNMLGIGFLVALTVLIRGTPWRTRGSFIKVGSSFAGT